jgi:hypothetical protein
MATNNQQRHDAMLVINSDVDREDEPESSEIPDRQSHLANNDDDYIYFKEKFNKMKLQIPVDSKNANVLWSIDTTNPPHIGNLPYLLIMNMLNKSTKTFTIISHVRGYFGNLNSELSEHDAKMNSYYEILNHFNIGTIIKSDDIYYTKEYQNSLFHLTRSINITDAIESVHKTVRASDLMSIIFILTDIFYFNISHVIIEEHEVPLYKFISGLLLNEDGKTLEILEIPTFRDLQTNIILLDATRDQIHEQFSKLKPTRKAMIRSYLKAMTDVLYNEQMPDIDIADIIIDMRRKVSLSDFDSPIYVAVSFLTDQFHVLKKHWKKNVNKEDKCTGTGKGIDGLQANQKGFEPPLGGKFIIINWLNKEIVYTLDLDAPAGFFIEDHYLYIANNRLNYISIIDLISRIEIKRIDNSAFNCLHSLHRGENETLLLTSTGIDAIIQINSSGRTINDWYATEHEYTTTPKGEKRSVQRDFDHHHYIYPTLHQTTHINSAIILDSDYFLVTLFHQGLLVKIHRTTGRAEVLLSGLNCPHGIKRYRCTKQDGIAWMLCNTKQNELLFLNDDYKIIQKMILEDVNWLQDATQIQNGNIIITDDNNSRIIEIDPDLNTIISEFVYSVDWRIYQISDLADFQTSFVPDPQINS